MITVAIVFFAAMIQAAMGFGMALVAMPLLIAVWGIQTASPAFALLGTTATFINAVRWRGNVTRHDLVYLLIPALIGVPIGVWILNDVSPVLVTRIMGVLLIAYALYSLAGLRLPPVTSRLWAHIFGFFAGILTGAYNAGGPPIVVYGSACNWSPDRFKANMQTFFFVMGVVVVISHAISNNLTRDVWEIALVALPGLLLGNLAGIRLGRYCPPDLFRKLVLILLILLGVQLLI